MEINSQNNQKINRCQICTNIIKINKTEILCKECKKIFKKCANTKCNKITLCEFNFCISCKMPPIKI